MKIRKIIYISIFIVILLTIIVLFLYSDNYLRLLAYNNSNIVKVASIERVAAGPQYLRLIGTDSNGGEWGVWIERNISSIPHVVYSVRLDKGISSNNVIDICNNKGIINISSMQIVYIPLMVGVDEIEESTYWYVVGKNNSSDLDNCYMLIDFFTGEIVDFYEGKVN